MEREEKTEMVRGERKQHNCPPPPGDCPWLFFRHCEHMKTQTFYSLSENNSYLSSIPELVSNKVWNSCHGWLILSTKDSPFFSLWNPITFETIRLPSLELDHQSCIESCVLSSPPGNPDSTLFLFDKGISSIWFCRLHYPEHHWFKHCYKEEIQALSNIEVANNFIYRPACCDNKVYAMSFQGLMVVRIDIIEPHSLVLQPVIRFPYSTKMVTSCLNEYLVGSPREIFIVFPMYDSKFHGREEVVDIHIYKLDLSSMVWERVRSAKDRAFFFSIEDGNSCSAICSEDRGNRIYFTRAEDESLYTYHIEDANLSISLPCPNLPKPWESPIWLMPNTRITNLSAEALDMTGKEHSEKEQAVKESDKEAERNILSENKEKEAQVTRLFDLPIDLLRCNITERLILHDFMNFRLVSTLCRDAFPPIQWKTAACDELETESRYLSPWLIFSKQNGRICSFVSPPHTDRYYFQVPESLHDSRIFYCKDGWLLMGKILDDGNVGISFFNPLTKDVIPYEDLTDLTICISASRFVFSSTPTSSNCVVVVIFSMGFEVDIRICHSKEEGWVNFERDCNIDFDPFYTNPIFVDGAFYFLSENGNLGVLRIRKGDCDWEVLAQPEKDPLSFSESYLAERNGEVFLVLTGTIGEWVQVFMLDKSTTSWDKVEDLGNYTLYVSRTSSLFTVAKSPETRNIIYFPRFCGEHLVSYSLSTNSLHSSGTADTLSNYHGTMEPLVCCWTKPSWS